MEFALFIPCRTYEVMDSMWNRIIVLDKYILLSQTNTKLSLKRDPVLPFPSSKPLQPSHTRVLPGKYCTAGLRDISAYSGTHFGRSLHLKRTHYLENKSVCPSVFPFISESVYLLACLSVETESATKTSDLQECRLWKFFTKSCRANVSFMNISTVSGVLYYK